MDEQKKLYAWLVPNASWNGGDLRYSETESDPPTKDASRWPGFDIDPIIPLYLPSDFKYAQELADESTDKVTSSVEKEETE